GWVRPASTGAAWPSGPAPPPASAARRQTAYRPPGGVARAGAETARTLHPAYRASRLRGLGSGENRPAAGCLPPTYCRTARAVPAPATCRRPRAALRSSPTHQCPRTVQRRWYARCSATNPLPRSTWWTCPHHWRRSRSRYCRGPRQAWPRSTHRLCHNGRTGRAHREWGLLSLRPLAGRGRGGFGQVVVDAAQVGLQHGRVLLYLGRHALGKLGAEIHHHQMVGKPHYKVHIVLHQQNAHALVAQLLQHLPELLLF